MAVVNCQALNGDAVGAARDRGPVGIARAGVAAHPDQGGGLTCRAELSLTTLPLAAGGGANRARSSACALACTPAATGRATLAQPLLERLSSHASVSRLPDMAAITAAAHRLVGQLDPSPLLISCNFASTE